MPNITPIPNPIVGETYVVPVVNGWPVIEPPHVDDDHFNHTEFHYHIDSRFVDTPWAATKANNEPVGMPMVCLRDTPAPIGSSTEFIQAALHLNFGHVRHDGVCPHQRMPIHNGVCSGHRLKWCADGSIHHKPPYTVSVRGTDTKRVFAERIIDIKHIRLDVTSDLDGQVIVDMHDAEGVLIVSRKMDMYVLRRGDVLSLYDTVYEKRVRERLDREVRGLSRPPYPGPQGSGPDK